MVSQYLPLKMLYKQHCILCESCLLHRQGYKCLSLYTKPIRILCQCFANRRSILTELHTALETAHVHTTVAIKDFAARYIFKEEKRLNPKFWNISKLSKLSDGFTVGIKEPISSSYTSIEYFS